MAERVIEFPFRFSDLFSFTNNALLHLLDLGSYGRIVGWGIWREMNLALRDIGPRGAEVLSQELPFEWNGFAIQQSGKVRWSISHGGRTVVIWDLWNWVKRPPRQGETASALYMAIRSTGEKMGVHPRGYFGNGNLASPILRVNKVSVPGIPEIDEASRKAFYGGRIQSVRIGRHVGPVYEYDLNSAYAWGLSQLPEITGIGTIGDHCPWRLVEVSWDIPRQKVPIYPFPVRSAGGKVEYPRQGEGWQWSPLVNEAERHWPKSVWRVSEIPLRESATGRRPFYFVNDLYATRQSMTNPLEATVAKWTLSALWGKLCQRPHNRPERNSFRNLTLAGMATSLVNAELLRVAITGSESVLAFGVDSIIASNTLLANEGSGLGQWKASRYSAIEAYQPGFWRMLREDGTWKEKSRGVPEGAFDWEGAAREWKKYGSFGRVPVEWQEFAGLGSAAEGREWNSTEIKEGLVLLRPGGVKGLRDFQRAGAGGTLSWEPPDRIEDTENFGIVYGLDHGADTGQEVI